MMLGVPSIALSQAYKDRNNVAVGHVTQAGRQVVRDCWRSAGARTPA